MVLLVCESVWNDSQGIWLGTSDFFILKGLKLLGLSLINIWRLRICQSH